LKIYTPLWLPSPARQNLE